MEPQWLSEPDREIGRPVVGRFAPSPTGPLHFGSLVAALGSYCLARQAGGRWLLRMEDLDAPRVVPAAADEILRTLERLHLLWDGDPVWQSRRSSRYEEVLRDLEARRLLFPCGCSRREILAGAPHRGEEGPVYPGTCREGLAPGQVARSRRLRVEGSPVCFTDGLYGPQSQVLHTQVGDFVLHRADGVYGYQLAVVVDDLDAGVTQVVRGSDLLASTPRQIYLYGCLGQAPPRYIHLPLALSAQGEKLSKRHGALAPSTDSSILCRVLRFLGQDVPKELEPASAAEILSWAVAHFRLDRVGTRDRALPDS